MKQEEIATALWDLKQEISLYCSTRNEYNLSQTVLKIDSLIEQLDFSTCLNAIKRLQYKKMTETTGEKNKRLYRQYQALKTASNMEEVIEILEKDM